MTTALALFSTAATADKASIQNVVFGNAGTAHKELVASYYGQRFENISIGMIDIDRDDKMELVVRFNDYCRDDICATTVMYRSDEKWFEVINSSASEVKLIDYNNGDIKNIVFDGVQYFWNNQSRRFNPKPVNSVHISDIIEKSNETPDFIFNIRDIATSNDIIVFKLDLNKDGTEETIVSDIDWRRQGHNAYTDSYLFNANGEYVGSFISIDGYFHIVDDGAFNKIVAIGEYGFSLYAYNSQNLNVMAQLKAKNIK